MSRLVLSDRPFDSIKPRVGDMRPQPLPWGKGALPARLASGPVTCSAAGAVRWNRLLSSPETWQGEREDAQREQRGQGSRRVIAREPLPTCSRGLRTNTATTAILTVSSSRCQMTAQQGRGRVGPRSPAGAGQWQGTTPACPASRSASWAEGAGRGACGWSQFVAAGKQLGSAGGCWRSGCTPGARPSVLVFWTRGPKVRR